MGLMKQLHTSSLSNNLDLIIVPSLFPTLMSMTTHGILDFFAYVCLHDSHMEFLLDTLILTIVACLKYNRVSVASGPANMTSLTLSTLMSTMVRL